MAEGSYVPCRDGFFWHRQTVVRVKFRLMMTLVLYCIVLYNIIKYNNKDSVTITITMYQSMGQESNALPTALSDNHKYANETRLNATFA